MDAPIPLTQMSKADLDEALQTVEHGRGPPGYSLISVYVYEDGHLDIRRQHQPLEPRDSPMKARYVIGFVPHPDLNEASLMVAYPNNKHGPELRCCPTQEIFEQTALDLMATGKIAYVMQMPMPMHVV